MVFSLNDDSHLGRTIVRIHKTGKSCCMLSFFGIIVMAIGKRVCAMCRNGWAQAKAKGSNQSEKTKYLKKLLNIKKNNN